MSAFSIEEGNTIAFDVKIKVIGVGGGGGNAINHIIREGINKLSGMDRVDLLAANTDAQALIKSQAYTTLQLGEKRTKGLGAGMRPEVGRESAEESYEQIKAMLDDAKIVFIASGFGGGTGTGAAPIVARAAKDIGALTIAVVTTPFHSEGKRRMRLAQEGIVELKKECDSIVIIPNEKLLAIAGKNVGFKDSFKIVDAVLANAVSGMSSVILESGDGDINVDFADVCTAMSHRGLSLLGVGQATGEDSAQEAIKCAIQSPLLDNIDIKGAKGVLANFRFHPAHPQGDIHEAMGLLRDTVDDDGEVDIFFGTITDENMQVDLVEVTVIATGFADKEEEKIDPTPQQIKPIPTQKTGTDDLFADFYHKPAPRPNIRPNSDDLDAPSFKRFMLD